MGSDSPARSGRREADSTEPVGRQEFVLRRIHRNFYEDRPKDPIKSPAFKPTPSDTDGLSVFRESYCTPRELVEAARQPPTEYYVVRLRAGDVLDAGCSLVPDPQPAPQPAGHTLIPESRVKTAKESKPLQGKLMDLANKGRDIVWPRGVEEDSTAAEHPAH